MKILMVFTAKEQISSIYFKMSSAAIVIGALSIIAVDDDVLIYVFLLFYLFCFL